MIVHRFLPFKGRDDFFDRFVDEAPDLRKLIRFGSMLRFKFFFCMSQSKKGGRKLWTYRIAKNSFDLGTLFLPSDYAAVFKSMRSPVFQIRHDVD